MTQRFMVVQDADDLAGSRRSQKPGAKVVAHRPRVYAMNAERQMDAPHPSDARDFVQWATSPAAWFSRAEQLRLSSELLWQTVGQLFDTSNDGSELDNEPAAHGPAFLLVAGFALEAALKAAAIQTELNGGGIDRVIVAGASPKLQGWVKTHKLEALAARAGIEVDSESLTYLRRFERYLLWSGRYPVPLAPPKEHEPRGFDYQIGVQDRTQFQKLYNLAAEAFKSARQKEAAWQETTSIGNYREREAEWIAACTKWLRVVGRRLVEHAIDVAKGDRGVLNVNIDTPEMVRHVGQSRSFVRLDPIWLPSDEFIKIVKDRQGVGPETAQRWARELGTMDASRDVALFIHSTPDDDGRWFSRYVFLKEGTSSGSEAE